MFADEIQRALEAAPQGGLPAIAAVLWKAFAAGQVSEAEAEALSAAIELRKASGNAVQREQPPKAPGCARRAVGSRPRSHLSLERRRRWAASGRLPPALAARFTLAEAAVLAAVAVEVAKRGDCRLAIGHLAALAGVSETTVRNALRRAEALALVAVEERRRTAWRNDTNVVRVVSREWVGWLRLRDPRSPRLADATNQGPRPATFGGASAFHGKQGVGANSCGPRIPSSRFSTLETAT